MILRKVTALEQRILAQVRTWAEQQIAIEATTPNLLRAHLYADAMLVLDRMESEVMSLGKQYAKARRKEK